MSLMFTDVITTKKPILTVYGAFHFNTIRLSTKMFYDLFYNFVFKLGMFTL